MRLRLCGPLATAAFAAVCVLGSAQTVAQNAYVTNNLSNTVSVIDTATNAVLGSSIRSAPIPMAWR
jgi:DNA-binding beta-propeller fold protein YncE